MEEKDLEKVRNVLIEVGAGSANECLGRIESKLQSLRSQLARAIRRAVELGLRVKEIEAERDSLLKENHQLRDDKLSWKSTADRLGFQLDDLRNRSGS